ncbi:unnamed protein product [Parascedosporium putredinis]|uniref:Uncharacterized protein n=1 Tax=Parascedosporium putredinis TaxID=1442378 RepID=A0A9P1GVG2_9PEZI|nr:unnamed protein product [Parascedosporium putredinis]CAI7988083.1 unnamed protein product [Parascedosporium putredinis]
MPPASLALEGSRRAPMNAFAKDSANNSIGGSGPSVVGRTIQPFGNRGQEAFTDYAQGARKNNPKMPWSWHVHLLEGTPAARTVIQKREAEQAAETADGGLQRKKSLAQRIRGINKVPVNMALEDGQVLRRVAVAPLTLTCQGAPPMWTFSQGQKFEGRKKNSATARYPGASSRGCYRSRHGRIVEAKEQGSPDIR